MFGDVMVPDPYRARIQFVLSVAAVVCIRHGAQSCNLLRSDLSFGAYFDVDTAVGVISERRLYVTASGVR